MIAALVEAGVRPRRDVLRGVRPAGVVERERCPVITSAGSISAGVVVLAAGSWSGQVDLEPIPPPPVRPVRGQLVRLAWNGPPIRRVVWGRALLSRPVA
jgi:glycine oxidase